MGRRGTPRSDFITAGDGWDNLDFLGLGEVIWEEEPIPWGLPIPPWITSTGVDWTTLIFGRPDPGLLIFDQSGSGDSGGQQPANNGTNYKDCVDNFYDSLPGKAVEFGSPLALLPGWNPRWKENLKEWGAAIAGKLGGLFGSGVTAGTTTTTLTTRKGTTTVGSPLELWTEAGLGVLEKAGAASMATATSADAMVHVNCLGGDPNIKLYEGAQGP